MQPAPTGSLLAYLEQIPDPRGRQGRRHPLSAMLATVVCAILCGRRGYSAIAEWIHSQPVATWHLLGFTRRPPKLGAFRKLLMALAPATLEAVLQEWVGVVLKQAGLEGISDEELAALAMDGKSLRGTLAGHERAVHLLSLFDQRTGCTLCQMEVDGKTNEHKTALEILKTLVLKGRVITGDAMFCQRDLCQEIIEQEGHYLFEVKDNQPELKKAIAGEFEPAFSPLHRTSAA